MSYTPEVITILSLDAIFFIIAFISFFLSLSIVRSWDSNSTTTLQYRLEKRAVLVATFIKYIFILKLLLFLFYVFSADKISHVITGAMCAAGVVNSVDFGTYLILLKLFNIYLFGFWITLHIKDTKDETRELTKLKFWIFIGAFFTLTLEIALEFGFFNSLDIDKIVSCCGTLFSVASTSSLSVIFMLNNTQILIFFYGAFVLQVAASIVRVDVFSIISSILFLIVSIISLILFLGRTYMSCLLITVHFVFYSVIIIMLDISYTSHYFWQLFSL